jgi:molybdopterin molybdotransferase
MRGFATRSTVDAALAWVDMAAQVLESESVPAADSHGRVLAQPAVARWNVPAFVRGAMDGYAVQAEDTLGAGSYNPLSLRVAGESLPGRPWRGTIEPGTCVRIMTGAPLPDGADAVVPVEQTETTSIAPVADSATAGRGASGGPLEQREHILVLEGVPPGKHVGRIGEDVMAGREVLPAGRVLRPQDVGLLAAVGLERVEVVRAPRVRILVTGNELVSPGADKSPWQIVDSNTDMLHGLVTRDGGRVVAAERLSDQRELIRERLLAPGADIVLVSGGSSVGAEDHAPSLVAELGELAIHGVAMRPSSPAGMGRIGGALVFLLPGNPVSCLCAYDFFAGRAIRRMGGRGGVRPYRTTVATLRRKLVSPVGRVDYARVQWVGGEIEPLATSGASILSSTVRADGFVIVPAELEGYAPGSRVTVHLYDAEPTDAEGSLTAAEGPS